MLLLHTYICTYGILSVRTYIKYDESLIRMCVCCWVLQVVRCGIWGAMLSWSLPCPPPAVPGPLPGRPRPHHNYRTSTQSPTPYPRVGVTPGGTPPGTVSDQTPYHPGGPRPLSHPLPPEPPVCPQHPSPNPPEGTMSRGNLPRNMVVGVC